MSEGREGGWKDKQEEKKRRKEGERVEGGGEGKELNKGREEKQEENKRIKKGK